MIVRLELSTIIIIYNNNNIIYNICIAPYNTIL